MKGRLSCSNNLRVGLDNIQVELQQANQALFVRMELIDE